MIGCSLLSETKQWIMSVADGLSIPEGACTTWLTSYQPRPRSRYCRKWAFPPWKICFPTSRRRPFSGELPLPAPQSEEEIISDARRLLVQTPTWAVALPSSAPVCVETTSVRLPTRHEANSSPPTRPTNRGESGHASGHVGVPNLVSELVGLLMPPIALRRVSAAAEALTCMSAFTTARRASPTRSASPP